MGFSTKSLVRRLGWGVFFRLFTHLPSFLRLFARLVRDPRVSPAAKLLLVGVLGYLIFPLDLVPDFLPGLGQLDDVAVVLGGLKLFLALCPSEVVQQHVREIARGN